jgi:hypothetical protein
MVSEKRLSVNEHKVGVLPAKELLKCFENCVVFQLDAEVIHDMVKVRLCIQTLRWAWKALARGEKIAVEDAGRAMVD